MKNVAEFTIIGRVGAVQDPGQGSAGDGRLQLPAEGRARRVAGGHALERGHGVQPDHAGLHRGAHHQGRPGSCARPHAAEQLRAADGSRVYTVDLIAMEFGRLAQGSERVRQREAA